MIIIKLKGCELDMVKNNNYDKLINDINAVINEYQNDLEIGEQLKAFGDTIDSGSLVIVFNGDLGTRYRIAIPDKEKMRIVAWFQFARDCSIYFGVRKKSMVKRKTGSVKSIDGQITINLNEEYLPPLIIDTPTKDRFSFHGSGEIHNGEVGNNTYRTPIKKTEKQSELFTVAFEKVSNFDDVQDLRKNDIEIKLNISENQMLILRAYISPTDKVELVGINEEAPHVFLVINFLESDANKPLSLILVFSTILADPSPPDNTTVIWPTIDKQ